MPTSELRLGDCRAVMAEMAANSVDAIVTDPPYGIRFMGQAWDSPDVDRLMQRQKQSEARTGLDMGHGGGRGRTVSAFGNPAGKAGLYNFSADGNHAFQAWHESWAREAYRVLRPGGHLLAFGGTRTFHRLACALEDAGFEIRDTLLFWGYGQGFPKSSRINRSPMFCQCGEVARNDANSTHEPRRGDRIDTAAARLDDDLPREDARHSTRTPSGSLADCPQDSGSGDALAHSAAVGGQASPLLRVDVPARIRSGALADGRGGEREHNLYPARHSDRPSNPGSARLATVDASESTGTPASISASENSSILTDNETPADRTRHTASESLASQPPPPNYNSGLPRCPTCGKPIADGLGSALKPSYEPIVMARKPLVGSLAANVAAHGTGGLNIDATRIGTDEDTSRPCGAAAFGLINDDGWKPSLARTQGHAGGRWPANVVLGCCGHDPHDPDCAVRLLDEQSGERGGHDRAPYQRKAGQQKFSGTIYNGGKPYATAELQNVGHGDAGGPSRFFYVAKASRTERNAGLDGMPEGQPPGSKRSAPAPGRLSALGAPRANHHPTVKPIALMRYLCRLICPPNGTILDPFLGSGSTGCAAALEGFAFIGIEQDESYLEIAERRIAYWAAHGEDGFKHAKAGPPRPSEVYGNGRGYLYTVPRCPEHGATFPSGSTTYRCGCKAVRRPTSEDPRRSKTEECCRTQQLELAAD